MHCIKQYQTSLILCYVLLNKHIKKREHCLLLVLFSSTKDIVTFISCIRGGEAVNIRFLEVLFLHVFILQDFLGQLDFEKSRHLRNVHEREVTEIKPYIRKCLELSWEMVVQQPPMYLQFKVRHGAEADTTKFEFYSHPGSRIDYLVWPALLRDENGVLLRKGLLQAISEKP